MRVTCTVIACAVVLMAMVPNAEAIMVENTTTSTTLFFDDFEGVTPPGDANYALPNNGAYPGSWNNLSGWNIFVWDFGSGNPSPGGGAGTEPSASEKNQYLRVAQNNTKGDATLSVLQTSGTIHVALMLLNPSVPDISFAIGFRLIDSTAANVWSLGVSGDRLYNFDGSTFNWSTAPVFVDDLWQRVDVFHTIGTDQVSYQIDGGTMETDDIAKGAPSTEAAALRIIGGNTSALFFVDAVVVPLPPTLLLLACGLVALYCRRRKA